MGDPVTTERTRSPPVRPTRPADGGIEESLTSPIEHFSTVTVTGPGAVLENNNNNDRKQPSPLGVQASSEAQSKSRKRKSARYSVATASGERKGSIRKAVRRLFGRKLKEDDVPEVPQVESQSPRHAYHKSDPGLFPRPQTFHTHPSEAISSQCIISGPLSAPLAGPLSTPFILQEAPPRRKKDEQALKSPINAVEFPKSARLKPLDLGNPFYTRHHGHKRRATLPSLIMTDHEAAKVASFVQKTGDTRTAGTSLDVARLVPESDIGLAVTSAGPVDKRVNMEKRRSRSANDLRQAMMKVEPFRKRTDEIEYWRQSYASVLVSPTGIPEIHDYGHAAVVPHIPQVPEIDDEVDNKEEADQTPVIHEEPSTIYEQEEQPSFVYGQEEQLSSIDRKDEQPRVPSPHKAASARAASARVPSPPPRSFSRPLTTHATDGTTGLLEARIAKLEANLVDFQRSLSNLALSNPSASAASPEPPRSIHRLPTPSIFIERLHSPTLLEDDAGDVVEREWGPSSHGSTIDRPGPQRSPQRSISGPLLRTNSPNTGTFTALYNMLSEERSARRTLEHQVRNLQHEVTRLQLSRGSWGSYNNPTARPRTPEESDRGDSRQEAYNTLNSPATVVPPSSYLGAFDGPAGRIVSRFSGDSGEESEYSRNNRSSRPDLPHRSLTPPYEVPPTTPYDNYRTPTEEMKPYRFSEDEMF